MKVISYNAGNANTASVADDYHNLAQRQPDVIGSQEVSDRTGIISHVAGYEGIQLHRGHNSAHVALNVRNGLAAADMQLVTLNKLTWVGRLVAGARKSGKSKPKPLLSADVSGVPVGVTHLVPSWTRKRCVLARRLARKQVVGCVKWFNSGGDVLMMDGNGPADHPVFAPLREVAAPYAKGKSHGIERDIVWVRKGLASDVTVTALSGYSSDHPPVEAVITWKPKEKPVPVTAHAADLSHWNGGNIDFGVAKKGGIQSVWHKATEGASYVDPKHNERRQQTTDAGMPFGSYHFARPGDPVVQARHFLSVAAVKRGNLRPMLDLEDATMGNWSVRKRTRWVKAWVKVVAEAAGEPPLIYTRFDLADHFDCPLWVARYSNAMSAPAVPRPWKVWSIWQFTNGQFGQPDSAPGLGHVDLNTFNSGVTLDLLILGQKVRQQPRGPLTRGGNIDAALARLSRSQGKGDRAAAIKSAVDALESIPTWHKRK